MNLPRPTNTTDASEMLDQFTGRTRMSTCLQRSHWMQAFCQSIVWRRAAVVGLPIGVLQAVINQGDVWLRHEETLGTVAKTVISPLVTFSVALISAAGVWVERQRSANN